MLLPKSTSQPAYLPSPPPLSGRLYKPPIPLPPNPSHAPHILLLLLLLSQHRFQSRPNQTRPKSPEFSLLRSVQLLIYECGNHILAPRSIDRSRASFDLEVMDMAHERDSSSEEEMIAGDLRRGPWTVEEDILLVNYIAAHGEGRWNSLARSAGLKRTGKSCRLRWLNYLRPDLRRGSITPQEQLLILELHSRWGNRWSKIAQHLPGRTDNEIKNYWRTRVQKHAKQLKCDVNSQQFKDVMRYLWMPRLVERIQAAASAAGEEQAASDTPLSWQHGADGLYESPELPADACWPAEYCAAAGGQMPNTAVPELSSTTAGSSSPSTDSGAVAQPSWPATVDGVEWFTTACDASSAAAICDTHLIQQQQQQQQAPCQPGEAWTSEPLPGLGFPELGVMDFEIGSFDVDSIWSMDDLWYTQPQGV